MSFKFNIQSYSNSSERVVVCFDGLLTNKKDLSNTLSLNESLDNSELIREAFLRYGDELIDHLKGEFSFAIWDSHKKRLIAGRDHIGIAPLYYLKTSNDFFLSPDPKVILKDHNVKNQLDTNWPIKYLLNIQDDYTMTIHPKLKRLPAASLLIYENDTLSIKRYWNPHHKTKLKLSHPNEYIEQFQYLLNAAIANRIPDGQNIGAELSGGLDSSVVTAFANKILDKQGRTITSFSDVFPDQLPDALKVMINEKEDIKSVLKYAGIHNYQLVSNIETPLLDILDLSNEVHIEPPFRMINVFSSGHYKRAQELNITNLLSGFGGDESVSSPHMLDYRSMLTQGKFGYFIKMLFNTKTGFPLPDFAGIYRMITDLVGYSRGRIAKPKIKDKLNRSYLRDDILKSMKLEQYYTKYKSFAFSTNYYKKLNQLLMGPQRLPFRLHYCHAMTQNFNINYRYPLLDIDLIELFYSIPDHLKGDNNVSRKIFREAAKGYIPESIRFKTEKGGPSNPSHMTIKSRDSLIVIERLKESTSNPNHKIHDYVDMERLLKEEERILKERLLYNSIASRIYLLSKKLENY